jgi:hypothetical protein
MTRRIDNAPHLDDDNNRINQSLLTLSLVVKQLGENCTSSSKKKHVPYRDSKLTRHEQ